MKPTDSGSESVDSASPATDGGRASGTEELDVFSRTADVRERTIREKFYRRFDLYVRAPFAVAWTDIRMQVGVTILALFVLMGTVGVAVVPSPNALQAPIFLSPFQGWIFQAPFERWEYILGTDRLGRSVLVMVVHATPAMLKMIVAGALLSVGVGTILGTTAGYIGGWIDRVSMTITDTVLTIPAIPLIMVLTAIYQPENPYMVGLLLGIDNWPTLARTLRSQVLSIREEAFTEASRALGLSKVTILRMDVITNLMPYILINLANSSRRIIFESVALYYLAILPFTTENWGVILNEAYKSGNMTDLGRVHWLLAPMLAIILVSLGFILFAQGLDRVFNVRLRAKHAKSQSGGEEQEVMH